MKEAIGKQHLKMVRASVMLISTCGWKVVQYNMARHVTTEKHTKTVSEIESLLKLYEEQQSLI